MKRQKNYKERLAAAASTRYRSTYDGYLRYLSRGDWMTMRAYCRISHTDYRGMSEWLGATGLPVPARPSSSTAAAEDEIFEPVFSHVGQGVTWNRTAKDKIRGVTVRFDDGVTLQIREGRTVDVLTMVEVYRMRAAERAPQGGSPCSG